jgi:hypothetical protein
MFGLDRTATRIVGIIALVVVLCLAMAVLTMCGNRNRDDNRTQVATGKALDRVATETPVIRQEQAEKQNEAEKIKGADTRLPDGFGRSLERVRRGGKHNDPE